MKNNKSPGADGFTAEFLKFFWPDRNDFLYRAINEIFVKEKMMTSQKSGVITCIPKGNKDRKLL